MRACRLASDFTFELPDRPGELARLAGRLRAADVNLLAIRSFPDWRGEAALGTTDDEAASESHGALVGCVAESPDQFRNFAESAGLEITERPVFYIEGADETGALRHILEQVAGAGINIQSIEAVAFAGRYGAILRTAPRDWQQTAAILTGADQIHDTGAAT